MDYFEGLTWGQGTIPPSLPNEPTRVPIAADDSPRRDGVCVLLLLDILVSLSVARENDAAIGREPSPIGKPVELVRDALPLCTCDQVCALHRPR